MQDIRLQRWKAIVLAHQEHTVDIVNFLEIKCAQHEQAIVTVIVIFAVASFQTHRS
jgi:hypothetical protein